MNRTKKCSLITSDVEFLENSGRALLRLLWRIHFKKRTAFCLHFLRSFMLEFDKYTTLELPHLSYTQFTWVYKTVIYLTDYRETMLSHTACAKMRLSFTHQSRVAIYVKYVPVLSTTLCGPQCYFGNKMEANFLVCISWLRRGIEKTIVNFKWLFMVLEVRLCKANTYRDNL